ncbi:MAG: mycofactocin precursor MftA [Acidimicrobiales bacterium]
MRRGVPARRSWEAYPMPELAVADTTVARESAGEGDRAAQRPDEREPVVVAAPASGLLDEVLVEEISIDGMCGVY